uniref:DNA-directed RNA polymerases I and III subunit RPAC1 n=1 Tax=Plectus sambesii TaxID=2011161 RepID=A0A914VE30_9BILA
MPPVDNRIFMDHERVLNTHDANSDMASSSEPWSVEKYCERIRVEIVNETSDGMELEFDLIGVEAPIANALRRVLLAEVPTMAIEKIYMYQNTSLIQDEVLSHRLGLLPIRVDPRKFAFPLTKTIGINESGVDCDSEPPGDPKYNVIFELKVKCTKNPTAPKDATEPKDVFINSSVYSSEFTWCPIGDQETELLPHPAMVHDDILVAKLRPGQEIEARCHCVKGLGRDHAKFSPVCTATYRLLPIIKIKEEIKGEAAHLFQKSFSDGVIAINVNSNGEEVAVVQDARRDLCSRNVLIHEELASKVELSRQRDHFMFSVESSGALRSSDLVVEACKVLEEKTRDLRRLVSSVIR